MIHYKSQAEIESIRKSSLLVSKTLAEVAKYLKPGVTTITLDKITEDYIRSHGATPVFKGFDGFPASICASVNDEVVHGIPGKYELKDGDIISIDCGVILDGYIGDSAYTFMIGEVTEDVKKLLEVTKKALYLGLDQAIIGNRIGDIGYAIQQYAEFEHGYGIVRELVGHGVGKELHESPEVPNYGKRGGGTLIKEGLVIAIEPMINLGAKQVVQGSDGWTISTKDKKPSAHFEHTVAVGKGKADVLSSFEEIEEAIAKNNELSPLLCTT